MPVAEGDEIPVFEKTDWSPMPFGQTQTRHLGPRDPAVGRWPANVVHDGSDEVLAEFPHTVNPYGVDGVMHPAPNGRSPMFGVDKRTFGLRIGDEGNAARYYYCAKPAYAEREAGLDGFPVIDPRTINKPSNCLLYTSPSPRD